MQRQFTTRPEILGTFGVVATTHWLATAAGMAILEKGGNAFDAAVATGFALQVVEPHLNGAGGDVPMILHEASSGKTHVLCGQGPAAMGQDIAKMKELGFKIMPGTGHLSAVVPGALGAWIAMLRDFGTMSLADVLEHAICFAEDGYPLVPNISNTIETVKELFETAWPTSAAIYLPGGQIPAAGTIFRNPDLGKTFRRIISEGESASGGREAKLNAAIDAVYKGFIAEGIDAFMREPVLDSSGERHTGLLTGDDLAKWQPTYEPPLTYDYKNFTVCKTGPWGQGPALLQQLALLKGFDMDKMDVRDPEFVHTIVECAKLAFADREAFYGDPDFVDVPVDVLLSDAYNAERRTLVTDNASRELRPGRIDGFGGAPICIDKEDAEEVGAGIGEPTVARFDDDNTPNVHDGHSAGEFKTASDGRTQGDTCHVDIIDKWGNMVACTPSGGWLQSNPIVPGLGLCLTNRGQMYWLDERKPDHLAPGKRPRTTLSPGFALRDGEAYMPFGTPGGDQQDQWALSFFIRHVDCGLNLQEAIDAPAFHTAHFPSSFYPRAWDPGHLVIEGRFPRETQEELKRRGHRLEVDDDWAIGRLSAASRDRDGLLRAAANPRFMQGYAIGR